MNLTNLELVSGYVGSAAAGMFAPRNVVERGDRVCSDYVKLSNVAGDLYKYDDNSESWVLVDNYTADPAASIDEEAQEAQTPAAAVFQFGDPGSGVYQFRGSAVVEVGAERKVVEIYSAFVLQQPA